MAKNETSEQPRPANIFEMQEKMRAQSEFKVCLLENGYLMKTRSGWWAYQKEEELFKAIGDYLALLKKEKTNDRN